jgi:hypothetical protein
MPREQKLDLVCLRASNPVTKDAHHLVRTDCTVRAMHYLASMIGDVVREPEQWGQPRKLN